MGERRSQGVKGWTFNGKAAIHFGESSAEIPSVSPESGIGLLEDESGVPEEDRMAYRVLKNANMVPPEVTTMNELAALRQRWANETDPAEKVRLGTELATRQTGLALRLERCKRR